MLLLLTFLPIFTVLLALTFSKPSSKHSKRVTVITSNKRKVEDASYVFEVPSSLVGDDVDEIQNTATSVAFTKVSDLFKKFGTCLCEDTSLGLPHTTYLAKNKNPVFPALVKHLIDACKVGDGKLVDALKAISPNHSDYNYTSTVAFCDGANVVLFQCIMIGTIRNGGGTGDIDPYFVPSSYTLVRIEDNVTVSEYGVVNNPDQKTIGEQPENRSFLHPRLLALKAAKSYLDGKGYTIIDCSVSS